MGRNFDNHPGFQPKIAYSNEFAHHCSFNLQLKKTYSFIRTKLNMQISKSVVCTFMNSVKFKSCARNDLNVKIYPYLPVKCRA